MTEQTPGGALADSASASAESAGSRGQNQPVNPYCECDPCRCQPPCTCGLRLVGHEITTEWDPEHERLRYSVTDLYGPDADGARTS